MKIFKITFIALVTSLAISCDQKVADTTVVNDELETVDVASADNLNSVTTVDAANAPILTLESDSYDFGDVVAGSKNEKVIEFTNTGNTPLVIQKASASCGCTVPEYSKEPVAPGEKGQLTVAYTAPAVNGAQSKTVTLNTNTAKSIETFRIKANVVGGSERNAPKPAPVAPAQNLPAPDFGKVK